MDWFQTSAVPSVIGIIIAVAMVIVALKLIRTIAKPLITIIIIVAAVLIFFNVIDLAFLAATGKKALAYLFNKGVEAGKDAITGSISSFLMGIF